MLTPDLLPVRRKNGELCLTAITGKTRQHHLELAEQVVEIAANSQGLTREQFQQEFATIGQTPTETRIVRGYVKLIEDATEFEQDRGRGAAERRQLLFEGAAAAWQSLESDQRFDRRAVLDEAARASEIPVEQFEAELFVDLPSAQRVLSTVRWDAERLVAQYEQARVAAVLLRAVKVVLTFRIKGTLDVRSLFQKLKFRQLMFEIERISDGRYRLTITGPYSLFESVTKYGLQLALCWPEIAALDELQLEADLRWGKQAERLKFRVHARDVGRGATEVGVHRAAVRSDEVTELVAAMRQAQPEIDLSDADCILDLPGVGLCVPDLCYRAPNGALVYLEIMGYWSRQSVWRRVELVEAGLVAPVLFLVSSRLRVSEEVLDEQATSALLVYRGRISPAKVLMKLNELAVRPGSVRTTRR